MKIKIQAGANTWLIATKTVAVLAEGTYEGRLLNEVRLNQAFSEYGTMPLSLSFNIANYDGFIPRATNLWAQNIIVTTDVGRVWSGKITAQKMVDGVLQIRATEKSAPELSIQLPDEIARVVTVDENFHVSALNVTLPLPIGGNVANPIALRGILVNKNEGIYVISVGELHQFVSVRAGDVTIPIAEAAAAGYATYAGTAGQASYPGIAYVQITDPDKRKNDDGSYVDIGAEVVGVKLGTHTIEECRNGARFLYWLLKTPAEGGWGIGLSDSDIDLDSISESIAKIDTAGLKMDGVFYFRQPAMSWINQICLAIRGRYWIGADSKRSLFVNAASSSVKTYDSSEIKVLGSGREDYTGIVFNKGTLHFDYNPITSKFMQSVTFRDEISIAALGEQEFEGQSYLLRDRASAQAILDYTCKKSIIGAETVEFQTRILPDEVVKGAVITLDVAEESLSGDWSIYNLDIGDRLHIIRAERYDSSVFSSSSAGSDVAWSDDLPIVSAYAPGEPSGLDLTSGVDYDSSGDGSAIPYIAGAFEIPAGKYIGAAIAWGEGADPSTWNDIAVKGNTFKISPVKAGQLYTVRVTLFNQTKTSAPISESITAASHNDLPPTPGISTQSGMGCIIVTLTISDFTALTGFQIQRRNSSGLDLADVISDYRGLVYADGSATVLADYEESFQYRVRSKSRSKKYSEWSSWTTAVSASQVGNKDITADQITGKDFGTDPNVGAGVDGVRFNRDGIAMWQGGVRRVWIPKTGDPVFDGTLTAGAGYIGSWQIFPGYLQSENIRLDSAGSIQTVDFVSGHRGWKLDKLGRAELLDVWARGAVKTVVFEKDEVSVIGGEFMVRPSGLVAAYDYDAFLEEKANTALAARWLQLAGLVDSSDSAPTFEFSDYDDYYDNEAGFYRDIATALGYSVFFGAIAEADYNDAAKDSYFSDCWDALNDILDESNVTPSFASMTFSQYLAAEEEYFDLQSVVIDDPPEFEPAIAENDTRIYLDDTSDFSAGDILRLKDGVSNDYWAEIESLGSDETGSFLDLIGKSGEIFDVTPGQTVVNYGGIGAGGILLDGQSPLLDIYTHDGEPWNGTTPWIRLGNLEGWGAVNHRCFGFAAGSLAGHHIIYRADTGELTIAGNISIVAGSGLGNFADAGALATLNDIDLSYVTDAGAAAGADDLDGISDGSTYKRTTQNEKTGAARAYSGLDSNNSLITKVIPGAAIGTPAGAGLFLGSDKLGFYNGGWKTYMDNSGNFGLVGSGTHGLTWNGSTLAIAGNITILGGSGYGNLTDKPTALSGINSDEGSKLSGIEAGADVTGSHTSADTNNVAGTAAATVRDNASNALANAATAQSTADGAASSAATANSLLSDIAADNKFTPSEKHAARQEWDIIAAEQVEISQNAMNIAGYTPGIDESSYGESAKNAYWSDCWSRINDILDESNAAPTFPAQTYDEFVAEESEYFTTMQLVLFDEPITVPPVADVLALNTDYIEAFQALADYLNAGSAWSSGVPSWIADGNLSTTTNITGSTFRSTWKAYYDARTALLNAIAAKSKRIADLAQAAAGDVALRVDSTLDKNNRLITAVVPAAAASPDGAGLFMGSDYMGFYNGGWKTYMDNAGNFALIGDGTHGMSWDAARGVLTVVGDITVHDGAITTAKLATDAIKSANYSTTAGSFFNLSDGVIKMGGSSDPALSWDGSTLILKGSIVADDGSIGGIGIVDSGLFGIDLEEIAGKNSAIAILSEALDSPVNMFDMGSAGINLISYTFGPALNSQVRIAASGYYDGSSTDKAHIKIVAESSSNYSIDTNGIIRGDCVDISDERVKSNINAFTALDRLRELDVLEWEYDDEKITAIDYELIVEKTLREKNIVPLRLKSERKQNRRPRNCFGPMAGAFNRLFGAHGLADDSINLSDPIGVALRSIQELAEMFDDLKAENDELRQALKLPKKQRRQKPEPVKLTDEEREYIRLAEAMSPEVREQIRHHREEIMQRLRGRK